jgi:flagellar motor switch protein FliG
MMAKEEKPPVNLNLSIDDDESITQDEAFAKIAMLLGNTKQPKILSELDDREIRLIASLFAVAEKVNDTMILSFLNNFLLLRVSNKRQGRSELLDVAKSSHEGEASKISRLKSFFGGVR